MQSVERSAGQSVGLPVGLLVGLLVGLCWGATPSLAAGPQPPRNWNRPPPARPAPPPKPGDVLSGSATLVYGGKTTKLGFATGEITRKDNVYGLQLEWRDRKETSSNVFDRKGIVARLLVGVPATGDQPPPVVIAMLVIKDESGLSLYKRNLSVCTVIFTKLAEKLVEGSAKCPTGLRDDAGKPARPLDGLQFRAVAK